MKHLTRFAALFLILSCAKSEEIKLENAEETYFKIINETYVEQLKILESRLKILTERQEDMSRLSELEDKTDGS